MEFQFNPPYSISGEVGKRLDSGRRTLEAAGVVTASLSLRSRAADELTWSQEGGVEPEYLQAVSVWDATGKRVFTGHVEEVTPEWDGTSVIGYDVRVVGPWWWLEQAQLTQLVSGGDGKSAERAVFVFPQQDLAISIRALLDRMQALGVPMQSGEIDPTFEFFQMVSQGKSAADALLDMLGAMPDAATRVRYDADGLPALDVVRRPTAPVVNVQLGRDDVGVPRLRPRRSLRPAYVEVATMRVDATGQIVYGSQVAGDPTGTTGPLGKQLVALSGTGRRDYEPKAPRVAAVTTQTILPTRAQVVTLDKVIADAIAANGDLMDLAGPLATTRFPTLPRFATSAPTAFMRTSAELLDWQRTEFGLVETQARFSGWVFFSYIGASGFGASVSYLQSIGRAVGGFQAGASPEYCFGLFVDFTVPVLNVDANPTIVQVHPEDQALLQSPAGLADSLFAAQDWVPYEGSMPVYPGGPMPLPGARLNLRDGIPEWATMGAMVTGLTADLVYGGGQITTGAPSGAGGSSLLDMFARPTSGTVIRV